MTLRVTSLKLPRVALPGTKLPMVRPGKGKLGKVYKVGKPPVTPGKKPKKA